MAEAAGQPHGAVQVVTDKKAPAGETPRGCWAWLQACDPAQWLAQNVSYFALHLSYFTMICIIGGCIIYGIEGNESFIDCLFMAVSAGCVTGLTTIDPSTLRIGSQVTIWALVLLGSAVLMSAIPPLIRRYYFNQRATEVLAPVISDEEARERLLESQIEYRALGWISKIALAYYAVMPLLVALVWGIYFNAVASRRALVDSNGTNPWWWAFFHSYSAMNNAGFGLLSDNLISFADDYVVLLLASFVILCGNVAYPIFIRIIVAALHKVFPKDAALAFLLDNPRHCFTHMFSAKQTVLLAGAIVGFTLVEYILFLALDFNAEGLGHYPPHIRALIGWFQSISTRTAGFNAVDLNILNPSMQVVYALMMYMGAYPFILSVRKTSEDATDDKDSTTGDGSEGATVDMLGGRSDDGGSMRRAVFDGTMSRRYPGEAGGDAGSMVKSVRLRHRRHRDGDDGSGDGDVSAPSDSGAGSVIMQGASEQLTATAAAVAALPAASSGGSIGRLGNAALAAFAAALGSEPSGGSVRLVISGPRAGPPMHHPVSTRLGTASGRNSVTGVPVVVAASSASSSPAASSPPSVAVAVSNPSVRFGGVADRGVELVTRSRDGAAPPSPSAAVPLTLATPPRTPHLQAPPTDSLPASAHAGEASEHAGAVRKARLDAYGTSSSSLASPAVPAYSSGEDGAADESAATRAALEVVNPDGVAVISEFFEGPEAVLRRDSYVYRDLDIQIEEIRDPATVGEQARAVASRDLVWLFVALLVMCIADASRLANDPNARNFSIFGFFFEIMSAYGTVGLSLGYPGSPLSLSGQMSVVSKLVLMLVMLAGRHRGLPMSIDKAIYLPKLLNKGPAVPPQSARIASGQHTVRRHRHMVPVAALPGADDGGSFRADGSVRSLFADAAGVEDAAPNTRDGSVVGTTTAGTTAAAATTGSARPSFAHLQSVMSAAANAAASSLQSNPRGPSFRVARAAPASTSRFAATPDRGAGSPAVAVGSPLGGRTANALVTDRSPAATTALSLGTLRSGGSRSFKVSLREELPVVAVIASSGSQQGMSAVPRPVLAGIGSPVCVLATPVAARSAAGSSLASAVAGASPAARDTPLWFTFAQADAETSRAAAAATTRESAVSVAVADTPTATTSAAPLDA